MSGGPVLLTGIVELAAASKEGTDTEPGTPPLNLTVDAVLDNPLLYLGEKITVKGEVDDVVGSHAPTLEDDDDIAQEELPVLSLVPIGRATGPIRENESIRITGVLRKFVRAELEDEYDFGEVDLEEFEREFGSGPVLIVTDEKAPE